MSRGTPSEQKVQTRTSAMIYHGSNIRIISVRRSRIEEIALYES